MGARTTLNVARLLLKSALQPTCGVVHLPAVQQAVQQAVSTASTGPEPVAGAERRRWQVAGIEAAHLGLEGLQS